MNTLKTVVLMTGLTVLLIIAGDALGGRSGMLIAFILCGRDELRQLLVQ